MLKEDERFDVIMLFIVMLYIKCTNACAVKVKTLNSTAKGWHLYTLAAFLLLTINGYIVQKCLWCTVPLLISA